MFVSKLLFLAFYCWLNLSFQIELSRKFVHENGIKEFTVAKEIKGNHCSCACVCIPPGVTSTGPLPTPPKNESNIPGQKQYTIVKEIKGNLCDCACTCLPKDKSFPHVVQQPTFFASTTPQAKWSSLPSTSHRTTMSSTELFTNPTTSTTSNAPTTLEPTAPITLASTSTSAETTTSPTTSKATFLPQTTTRVIEATTTSPASTTFLQNEPTSLKSFVFVASSPSTTLTLSTTIQSTTLPTTSTTEQHTKASETTIKLESTTLSMTSITNTIPQSTASKISQKVTQAPTTTIPSTSTEKATPIASTTIISSTEATIIPVTIIVETTHNSKHGSNHLQTIDDEQDITDEKFLQVPSIIEDHTPLENGNEKQEVAPSIDENNIEQEEGESDIVATTFAFITEETTPTIASVESSRTEIKPTTSSNVAEINQATTESEKSTSKEGDAGAIMSSTALTQRIAFESNDDEIVSSTNTAAISSTQFLTAIKNNQGESSTISIIQVMDSTIPLPVTTESIVQPPQLVNEPSTKTTTEEPLPSLSEDTTESAAFTTDISLNNTTDELTTTSQFTKSVSMNLNEDSSSSATSTSTPLEVITFANTQISFLLTEKETKATMEAEEITTAASTTILTTNENFENVTQSTEKESSSTEVLTYLVTAQSQDEEKASSAMSSTTSPTTDESVKGPIFLQTTSLKNEVITSTSTTAITTEAIESNATNSSLEIEDTTIESILSSLKVNFASTMGQELTGKGEEKIVLTTIETTQELKTTERTSSELETTKAPEITEANAGTTTIIDKSENDTATLAISTTQSQIVTSALPTIITSEITSSTIVNDEKLPSHSTETSSADVEFTTTESSHTSTIVNEIQTTAEVLPIETTLIVSKEPTSSTLFAETAETTKDTTSQTEVEETTTAAVFSSEATTTFTGATVKELEMGEKVTTTFSTDVLTSVIPSTILPKNSKEITIQESSFVTAEASRESSDEDLLSAATPSSTLRTVNPKFKEKVETLLHRIREQIERLKQMKAATTAPSSENVIDGSVGDKDEEQPENKKHNKVSVEDMLQHFKESREKMAKEGDGTTPSSTESIEVTNILNGVNKNKNEDIVIVERTTIPTKPITTQNVDETTESQFIATSIAAEEKKTTLENGPTTNDEVAMSFTTAIQPQTTEKLVEKLSSAIFASTETTTISSVDIARETTSTAANGLRDLMAETTTQASGDQNTSSFVIKIHSTIVEAKEKQTTAYHSTTATAETTTTLNTSTALPTTVEISTTPITKKVETTKTTLFEEASEASTRMIEAEIQTEKATLLPEILIVSNLTTNFAKSDDKQTTSAIIVEEESIPTITENIVTTTETATLPVESAVEITTQKVFETTTSKIGENNLASINLAALSTALTTKEESSAKPSTKSSTTKIAKTVETTTEASTTEANEISSTEKVIPISTVLHENAAITTTEAPIITFESVSILPTIGNNTAVSQSSSTESLMEETSTTAFIEASTIFPITEATIAEFVTANSEDSEESFEAIASVKIEESETTTPKIISSSAAAFEPTEVSDKIQGGILTTKPIVEIQPNTLSSTLPLTKSTATSLPATGYVGSTTPMFDTTLSLQTTKKTTIPESEEPEEESQETLEPQSFTTTRTASTLPINPQPITSTTIAPSSFIPLMISISTTTEDSIPAGKYAFITEAEASKTTTESDIIEAITKSTETLKQITIGFLENTEIMESELSLITSTIGKVSANVETTVAQEVTDAIISTSTAKSEIKDGKTNTIGFETNENKIENGNLDDAQTTKIFPSTVLTTDSQTHEVTEITSTTTTEIPSTIQSTEAIVEPETVEVAPLTSPSTLAPPESTTTSFPLKASTPVETQLSIDDSGLEPLFENPRFSNIRKIGQSIIEQIPITVEKEGEEKPLKLWENLPEQKFKVVNRPMLKSLTPSNKWSNMIEQATKDPAMDLGNILKMNAETTTETTKPSSNENINTKFVINDELARRIDQARQLREEQRRLEILASKERDVQLEAQAERRRIIEEKLEKLAETERWQHQLLQQAQLRQRAFANANSVSKEAIEEQNTRLLLTPPSTIFTTSTTITAFSTPATAIEVETITPTTMLPPGMPQHCAPVQKFLTVFKVKDPKQWLRENCVFVKQYFPTASCSQIETLLSTCFVSTVSSSTEASNEPSTE